MLAEIAAAAVGVAAGVMAGLLGVGGGLLFVPALTFGLGIGQLDAEATSLAAMLPAVVVGSYRQYRTGLTDARAATTIGLTSIGGVLAGASIAESLPERALERLFGVLLVVIAVQMSLTTRARRPSPPPGGGDGDDAGE
jgi:uncharacterized protein